MKKDRLFIVLVFAISLLLPLSGAYSCFDVIAEADFLTPGLKYEAVDIGNLFLDKRNLMGMVPSPFCPLLFLGDNFFEPLSGFSPPISLLCPTSSALRC